MIPEPPCGHGRSGLERVGYRMRCPTCGSFFDGDHAGKPFTYDEAYPESRGHFDAQIGALKTRSLDRWLERAGIDVRNAHVCEVGFGGAHCLAEMAKRAGHASGVEAVEANLERARSLGVTEVHAFSDRPERLARPVDLWLFLDSFEHLPEPAGFLAWMAGNSAPDARVLLVAPEAGSASERWLGRLWPHKIPDHAFHWSRRGLGELFEAHGFRATTDFHPGKYVSGAMVAAHLAHKLGRLALPAKLEALLGRVRVYFNFGEMGLVFARVPTPEPAP